MEGMNGRVVVVGGGDTVNHPDYYNWHPACECADVTQEFDFSLGNAIKYIWRAGGPVTKGRDSREVITDLQKAIWYIQRKIEMVQRDGNG